MFFTSKIIDLMLSLSLSLLTSFLSICSILKRFVVSCMIFLLILRLGIFVASLPTQVMLIHIILDFLVISVIECSASFLFRSLELRCGIA